MTLTKTSSHDVILDKHPQADVLLIDNEPLIDLETEDSFDFPFQGNEQEFASEIAQLRQILMESPPAGRSLSPHATTMETTTKPTDKINPKNTFVFGHSPQRVRKIQEENERLVKRLQQLAAAPSKLPSTTQEHDMHVANANAARVARQRKEDEEISKQNLSLYNKLQSTKPDPEVERSSLDKKYMKTREYISAISIKREKPKRMPPGMSHAKPAWNNRWNIASL